MNLFVVLTVGIGVGVLIGLGIFFEPNEPYKVEIFFASTIRNALVALLIGLSLNAGSSWLQGTGFGLLYGFLFGMVVFLAKGGFKAKDAPYVLPAATVSGGLVGLILVNFAF